MRRVLDGWETFDRMLKTVEEKAIVFVNALQPNASSEDDVRIALRLVHGATAARKVRLAREQSTLTRTTGADGSQTDTLQLPSMMTADELAEMVAVRVARGQGLLIAEKVERDYHEAYGKD